MKQLKTIVKIISGSFFSLFILFIFIMGLVAGNVKSDLLLYELPNQSKVNDTIVVHFIHGSVKKDSCSYNVERLGGFLGGHVELEINQNVFGFLFKTKKIRIVPKEKYNSKVEMLHVDLWKKKSKHDKITSIYIPISLNQKYELLSLLNNYMNETPFDYAFFGHRCTSFIAQLLSKAKVFNKFSEEEAIVAFFYPRSLRRTLEKYAQLNNLTVLKKSGIDCQNWE